MEEVSWNNILNLAVPLHSTSLSFLFPATERNPEIFAFSSLVCVR